MPASQIDFDAMPAIQKLRRESGYEPYGFEVLSSQSNEPAACCDGGQMCRKPAPAAPVDYRDEQNPPLVPVAPPPIANGTRRPPPRKRYGMLPRAALTIVNTLEQGIATYPEDDWPTLPVGFHLAKAEQHLYRYRVTQDDVHLRHALTRIAMEVEIVERAKELDHAA